MPTTESSSTRAGQAVYTPLALKGYDLWVLGVSNHWLWRCPTAKLRALYDRNVSANHLDVGVGTGYFLKHTQWPVTNPKVTLLDMNANSLASASQRIAHLSPKTINADVLQPLPEMGPFESVGLCYLLHCLPGTMSEKARVFDNVSERMTPSARIFGATIVQGDAPRSTVAQKLMDFYNTRGIFSNADDDVGALRAALETRFETVKLEVSGCVAQFEASKT